MKRFLLSFAVAAVLLLSHSSGARAQTEITLIAPGGARAPLDASTLPNSRKRPAIK